VETVFFAVRGQKMGELQKNLMIEKYLNKEYLKNRGETPITQNNKMNKNCIKIICIMVLMSVSITCTKGNDTNISNRSNKPHLSCPYIEQEVKFTNQEGNAHLVGTLTIPNLKGRYPAVVLMSGSGLQDRDETVYGHKPFKVLAEYLTRHNIAVLRYDDRTVGKSTGPLRNVTPEDFAQDAYSGLQYLKSIDGIRSDKIGVIGHSMGALEGSLLAGRHSDIAFLVMLAGPGIPVSVNMVKSDSVSNTRLGKSHAEVASGKFLLSSMISELKKGYDINSTEINLNKIISEWQNSLEGHAKEKIDEFTRANPDYWRTMASEWATPYYFYIINYDPSPVLKEIECPVLSLIGEKDVQVLPIENSSAIRMALESGKCAYYQVEIVKGVNHLFQKCESGVIGEYSQIEETFNEAVMELISNWIIEQTN